MKKLLLVLFVVLGTAWWLFGQSFPCPTDTLVNGGVNHQFAYSQGQPYTGTCGFGCDPDTYHCWQLPPNIDGTLAITGNVSPPFSHIAVVVTSSCRWIHFERCQLIGDPIVAPFMLQMHVDSDMQVCAYWNSADTDSVGAFIKGHAMTSPSLAIVGDLDTCGLALNVQDARETTYLYRRMDNGVFHEPPLPAGIYVAETLFPAGRKLIQVR